MDRQRLHSAMARLEAAQLRADRAATRLIERETPGDSAMRERVAAALAELDAVIESLET